MQKEVKRTRFSAFCIQNAGSATSWATVTAAWVNEACDRAAPPYARLLHAAVTERWAQRWSVLNERSSAPWHDLVRFRSIACRATSRTRARLAADGAVRAASGKEHPDLFWAARGGGSGLGVVNLVRVRPAPPGPAAQRATTRSGCARSTGQHWQASAQLSSTRR